MRKKIEAGRLARSNGNESSRALLLHRTVSTLTIPWSESATALRLGVHVSSLGFLGAGIKRRLNAAGRGERTIRRDGFRGTVSKRNEPRERLPLLVALTKKNRSEISPTRLPFYEESLPILLLAINRIERSVLARMLVARREHRGEDETPILIKVLRRGESLIHGSAVCVGSQ